MASGNSMKKPPQMTEEERDEYIKKVNKDLDDFLNEQLRKSAAKGPMQDKPIEELLAVRNF